MLQPEDSTPRSLACAPARRRRLRSAALAATLVAAAGLCATWATGAVADCAQPRFQPQLMTPMALRTPRDAGLVVGMFPGGQATEIPTLELSRGRRTIALRREPIAPGLFRLVPDARRVYGRWTIRGIAGEPEVIFGRPGLPPTPARPGLSRVERYRVASGGASRLEVRAHFDFPVPDGVIAVIGYYGTSDEPQIFARAMTQRDEVVLWSSSGRCSALPGDATEPPSEGGPVRVAFVDRYGRVSPISEPAQLAAR